MRAVLDDQHAALRPHVTERVWLISDLQQSVPRLAERSLMTAYEDFCALALPCDQIWYLGDSVEGANHAFLDEMVKMQQSVFEAIDAPLSYVLGNHDMDPMRDGGAPYLPFREMVLAHPTWHTTQQMEDFYFWGRLGARDVLFFSDHCARDGAWHACHGNVYGDAAAYPHTKDVRDALCAELAAKPREVLTAGHYAFPGGNRATAYMASFLPLPPSTRLHVYGHAHIGDRTWAGKDWGRQISGIDDSAITQVNVSSLEHGRGNAIRSAFLECCDDGTLAIWFRNHEARAWEKSLFLKGEF